MNILFGYFYLILDVIFQEREAGVGDTNRARDRESTLREVGYISLMILY